ncbi:metal-dependent hydrolase (plasmid) [Clostridium perfringens]|uniref:metal-dependent hydrolase n=1 Tax=Clostridium perfringens TaxID=1502 RepID=UPI0002E9B426|nr:metal-dependent hydrolase [Clostridium perfringens]
MLYKTHLTTSLNVAIPALYLNNELSLLTLTGVGLGSLLPDLDTPNSFIGRRLKIISYPLSTIFKHRGFLHSITPVILIFILGIFLKSLFIKSIALGYLLHLVGDTFSESGIKWFLPFYNGVSSGKCGFTTLREIKLVFSMVCRLLYKFYFYQIYQK